MKVLLRLWRGWRRRKLQPELEAADQIAEIMGLLRPAGRARK